MDYGVNIVKYLMILLHGGLQITKATLPSCYWKVSMNIDDMIEQKVSHNTHLVFCHVCSNILHLPQRLYHPLGTYDQEL